jgi:hypothetical protein
VPYARTELIIDSQSHKYQRRIVFRIPRDLSRQMMILVSCTHVPRASASISALKHLICG